MKYTTLLSTLILSAAIYGAGYSLSHSIVEFRNFDRYVEVKGLDEETVKSNQATWSINFSSSNDNLKKLYQNISSGQDIIVKFLIQQGFDPSEIEKNQVSVTDNLSNSFNQHNASQPRFTANSSISLNTDKVDLLTSATQKTQELVQSEIILTSTNAFFKYTNLNSIKVEMLDKATQNAKLAAESFAKNSHSELGQIKKAQQGQFTISSGDDNSMYDSGTLMKKVRVVTSVQFFLK